VDRNELERIVAGHVTFSIRDRNDVEPGDILSFVYTDEDGKEHTAHRRVVDVVNTKDRDIPDDELVRYGITVAGLVLPEIGSLDALVAGEFVVIGLGFQKQRHDVILISPPAYLPPLTTPEVDLDVFTDSLMIPAWPDGMYTCMVKGTLVGDPRNAERQRIDIVETIIMLRVLEGADDMFLRVDPMRLRTGKAQDMQGRILVPWTEEQALQIEPVSGETSPFVPMDDEELLEYGSAMTDSMVEDAFDFDLGERTDDGPYDAELREAALGGPDEDPDA